MFGNRPTEGIPQLQQGCNRPIHEAASSKKAIIVLLHTTAQFRDPDCTWHLLLGSFCNAIKHHPALANTLYHTCYRFDGCLRVPVLIQISILPRKINRGAQRNTGYCCVAVLLYRYIKFQRPKGRRVLDSSVYNVLPHKYNILVR